MPEGDTIHRAAATLGRVLGGRTILAARGPAVDAASLVGARVRSVEARGKHLLVRFEDGRALRTHMRMTGSWHVYRTGEAWSKPERLARVVLEVDGWTAPCFNAPEVEILSIDQLARQPGLARLGPDVVADGFDEGEALARLRERPDAPIGEALLAQSAVAGIGNIYKSETLFVRGVDPFRRVRDLDDDAVLGLLRAARDLMRRNLDTVSRRTRVAPDGQRHWVYRRSGAPCRRCGTTIRMRRQGLDARSTYWCPACQR